MRKALRGSGLRISFFLTLPVVVVLLFEPPVNGKFTPTAGPLDFFPILTLKPNKNQQHMKNTDVMP